MNDSKESDTFVTLCNVAQVSLPIHRFPNQKYEYSRIAMLLVNCILLFSTILLNGISVITIRKSSQLRNKVCYFIILLQSIIDFGVGVVSIPLFIYYLIFPFLKTANCILIILAIRASYLPLGLSIATLSAMSMERYIGVLHPFHYKTKVTKKRILAYVSGNGLVLFSVLAYSLRNALPMLIYVRGSIFVFFGFTGFVYTRIFLVINKIIRSEIRITSEGGENLVNRHIRESRNARSCFLVVICFFLFLLPLTLATVFFSADSFHFHVYFNWAFTSIILNSSINSVIFFWTKALLRKEALKTFYSLFFPLEIFCVGSKNVRNY